MRRLIEVFFWLIHALCKVLLVVQVLACATVFVGRYIVGSTPAWADPVAMLCMVWLCILSSALAVRDDAHLRITVVDKFLSPRAMKVLNGLAALVVLGMAVFLVHAGGLLTQLTTRNKLPGLGIPTAWMTVVLPITGVAYLVALLYRWRTRNER
ncbi:MAG: TRAP transporter small permease [Planctomycetaceae bacterium]|nr:TRAP transporter small permease [Planctomycetaceae bacterium]